MGGIGLPGGAVYVNLDAINSRAMRSLTAAAGPLATTACAILLTFPFAAGLVQPEMLSNHLEFWAGLALLAFLQITALFLNLLPIPGLDGFGILEPFLPDSIIRGARSLGGFTFIILFFLFFNSTPVSRGFWTAIFYIGAFVNLDFFLVRQGLNLFQFWSG
jgi:Zn-dependent protease